MLVIIKVDAAEGKQFGFRLDHELICIIRSKVEQ